MYSGYNIAPKLRSPPESVVPLGGNVRPVYALIRILIGANIYGQSGTVHPYWRTRYPKDVY